MATPPQATPPRTARVAPPSFFSCSSEGSPPEGWLKEGFSEGCSCAEGLGGHLACGDFEDYLWTFTGKDGGFTLSRDGKAMTLTKTEDRAITATLEEGEGNLFKLRFAVGGYYFESGSYSLNYNARGLINAYASDPSVFDLYEYAGYSLDVFGDKATVNGKKALAAQHGSEVTVTLSPLLDGVSLE